MQVDILEKSPHWLDVLYSAMKTCHSERIPQLGENGWGGERREQAVLALARRGHLSVYEHVSVTFGVSGVSRALLAQYSRHRIGVSLSVQSQRYVSESSQKNSGLFEFVTPPKVAARGMSDIFEQAMRSAQAHYDALIDLGIPPEDARFVLPNAAATNFVTTLNLRSLLDMYHKRCKATGAQWEIIELLDRMAALVIEAEPWAAELFE